MCSQMLVDWMLNSWEHCEDYEEEAKFLGDIRYAKVMQDWVEDVDHFRIEIELSYHKSPEIAEYRMKVWICRKLVKA